MKLLRLAVENKRWDLAALTVVLATVRLLKCGDNYGRKGKAKKKEAKRHR